MVKIIVAAVIALVFSLPALAQDEFPRVEMSFGYANLAFPCCGSGERHSGFSSTQGLNLTRILGIENYFGYYSLGNNVSMISNMFGGKIAARTERAVPYFVAGIGVGYITDEVYFGQSGFATRWGPGIDIKINEGMAWKVEATRNSFRFGGWVSGWNVSTGISFALSN
jgi:hypothetical protein